MINPSDIENVTTEEELKEVLGEETFGELTDNAGEEE